MAQSKLDFRATHRPPRDGEFIAPPPLIASKCVDFDDGSEWDDDMGISVRPVKLLTFKDVAQPAPAKVAARKIAAKRPVKKKAKRKARRKR